MAMRKLTAYGPSVVVLLTAAIVLIAGPRAVQSITYSQTSARIEQASIRLAQDDNILGRINQAYRDVATAVEPSVVHISAQRPALSIAGAERVRMAISSGSGWIYDEEGHVVTNYHVVEGAREIDVQLHSGEIRQARIVGYDNTTDIALLKIPEGRLHPAMRSDPQDAVKQGDIVFAFGSPFDFRFSMSSGVVSGKGRFANVIGQQFGSRTVGFESFIQTDAAINPGNSGGPLTDYRGRVVGMNTAIATATRRSQDGRFNEEGQFGGVGLAIPLSMIEPVVTQLITTGEVQKGFMGVTVVNRADAVADELRAMGLPENSGVLIAHMSAGGNGATGLRTGDVIMSFDRHRVSSPEQLLALTVRSNDEPIEARVWRYDARRNRGRSATVTLDSDAVNALRNAPLLDMSEKVSRRLNHIGFRGHGVPIVHIDRDGPAHEAGIHVGDVITHINDEPVAAPSQLQSAISSMLPDDIAQVRLWRYDPLLDAGAAFDAEVVLARADLRRLAGLVRRGADVEQDSLEPVGIAKMSTATPEKLREFGQGFHPGVLIEEIVPGSRLEGRLEPGSVIVSVGDRTVRSIDEFIAALSLNLREGAHIVFRDPAGNFSTGTLEVE